jgi:hypothetical protein
MSRRECLSTCECGRAMLTVRYRGIPSGLARLLGEVRRPRSGVHTRPRALHNLGGDRVCSRLGTPTFLRTLICWTALRQTTCLLYRSADIVPCPTTLLPHATRRSHCRVCASFTIYGFYSPRPRPLLPRVAQAAAPLAPARPPLNGLLRLPGHAHTKHRPLERTHDGLLRAHPQHRSRLRRRLGGSARDADAPARRPSTGRADVGHVELDVLERALPQAHEQGAEQQGQRLLVAHAEQRGRRGARGARRQGRPPAGRRQLGLPPDEPGALTARCAAGRVMPLCTFAPPSAD